MPGRDPTEPLWEPEEQAAREAYARELRSCGGEGPTWAVRVLTWQLRRLPLSYEAAIRALMGVKR